MDTPQTAFPLDDSVAPGVLASDLDGTLIPLDGRADNREALRILSAALASTGGPTLLFATGRHFESVLEAINQYGLPTPEWIVCDVGTNIYRRAGDRFALFKPYEEHLDAVTGHIDRGAVESLMEDLPGLTLQPRDHQRRFKISYYCRDAEVEAQVDAVNRRCRAKRLPFVALGSVDPFNGKGLVDILPEHVQKAYALIWLATHADFDPNAMVYAGDSGNDAAALTCGFRAIAVRNMDPELARALANDMACQGRANRFYQAQAEATSGVLEGCRHFGLPGFINIK